MTCIFAIINPWNTLKLCWPVHVLRSTTCWQESFIRFKWHQIIILTFTLHRFQFLEWYRNLDTILRLVHTATATALFWCHCRCRHEWVQYSFMMAMTMETIVTRTEKWVSWNRVMMFTLCVIATATVTKEIEFSAAVAAAVWTNLYFQNINIIRSISDHIIKGEIILSFITPKYYLQSSRLVFPTEQSSLSFCVFTHHLVKGNCLHNWFSIPVACSSLYFHGSDNNLHAVFAHSLCSKIFKEF